MVQSKSINAATRGGRMLKWKGKAVSSAPFMMFATVSVAALSIGMAHAETISSDVSGPVTLVATEDHTITGNASVVLSSSSDAAVTIDGSFSGSFTNAGSIIVDGTSAESVTGLYVNGDLEAGGQIINNGTILLEQTADGSEIEAYGIYIDGDLDGAIRNTGNITLDYGSIPDLADEVSAYGIYVDGNVGETGVISNSGEIAINAFASSTSTVYGIYLNGDLGGAISNSGTIFAEAIGDSEDGYAYGIYVDDALTATGSIENSGTITARGITRTDSTASAYGIYVGATSEGTILNSGTIDVLASAQSDYYAFAWGILVDSAFGGSVSNTGTITATANAVTSSATAFGIDIDGTLLDGGSVTNTGTISAMALTLTDSSAEAYGVRIDSNMEGTSSFVNEGTIISEAKSSSDNYSADAWGVQIDGQVGADAQVVNAGIVTSLASAPLYSATAYGIEIDGDLAGSFLNTGTIEATGIGGVDEGQADGIEINGVISGTFENTGTILSFADGNTSATAYGVYVDDGISATGRFENSGSISANATTRFEEGDARGIYIASNIADGGFFLNSGSVSANATGSSSATAYGIYVSSSVNGTLTNSGTIDVNAVNTFDSQASAYGIYVGSTSEGVIVNSGSINVTSTDQGMDESASAYGIYVSTLGVNGTLTNTGSISAQGFTTNDDGDDVEVYGIYISNHEGTLNHDGVISVGTNVTDPEDIYGIYLGNGSGTLNLGSSAEVDGVIRVNGHNVNMVADTKSLLFAFEDINTGTGVFTTSVENEGVAWFVDGEGSANPVYAAVATETLQPFSAVTANYGALLDGLGGGLPLASGIEVTQGTGGTGGFSPFVSANLSATSFDGTDGNPDAEVSTLDGTFGYAGTLGSGLALSVGGGVFTSSGDYGASDFESDGLFAGATVGQNIAGFDLEAGAGFGKLTTENSRDVGGGDLAEASIDSTFATVHLGVSKALAPVNGFDLRGYGELRYTNMMVQGYEEDGSMANAQVGDYTIGTTEVTLGLEGGYTINDSAMVTVAVNATSRMISDTDYDVTVFGTDAVLTSAASDFAGAGVAFGFEHRFEDTGLFEVSLGQEFGDGASGPSIEAGVRWSF